MLLPELPGYLTSLGGGEHKGLIISLFTITAMISRPFSGKLADKLGRVPVMVIGSVVCLICSLCYPILSSVSAFFLLRLIHGFSTGFTPTGQTAFLSDIIPVERRGEAMGILGTAGSLGMASGPAIGGVIANHFGLDAMFYCSSFFALLSIAILYNIKETQKRNHPVNLALLKVSKKDLFEPRVWVPCVIMLLCAYAYGCVFTVIPDFGEFMGIKNKGLLFTYLTVATLIVRLLGGKASDRWGRRSVLMVSTFVITSAMIIVATAESRLILIAGMVIYGLGHGATSPTLLAWATDLSDEQHKGRGISTLYIFMELGIGVGAVVSGYVYGNNPEHFVITFGICALLAFLAFVYLILTKRQAKLSS